MTTLYISGLLQPRVMMTMMNTDQEAGLMELDKDKPEASPMEFRMKETGLGTEDMVLRDKGNLVCDIAAWNMQIKRIFRTVHDALGPTQKRICEKCSCQKKGKNLLLMYQSQELWDSTGKRNESK